jgi:hypothetical protein
MPPPRRFAAPRRAAILVAAAVGLVSHAPAQTPDCAASYANYEADWAITRAQWDADCAAGRKPDEILRSRQQTFMTDCAAYFQPFLAKAKVEDWNLQVYCAQGASGENKLSAMTGAPSRRAPPAPSAPRPPPAINPSSNPAAHFYSLIDTTCGPLPRQFADELPKGLSPQSHFYGTLMYKMYVSKVSRPPLCLLEHINVMGHGRCDPNTYVYVDKISDAGCTGKLATMTLTDAHGNPVDCSQRQIDSLFSDIEKEYLASHPSLPR